MDRETVIKALECCTIDSSKCSDCPRYGFVPCTKSLLTDALSLIKELTEENEKLLDELKGAPLMPSEYEVLYKGKCEENKGLEELVRVSIETQNRMSDTIEELTRKLKIANLEIECKERICESYMLQYGTVVDKEFWLKQERADTARKMKERLKEVSHMTYDINSVEIEGIVYVSEIDQIAKEIIGEAE